MIGRKATLAIAALAVAVSAMNWGPGGSAHAGSANDPESVAEAASERFAAGDKAGWLSYYSEDAVTTDVGLTSVAFVGLDAHAFVFDIAQGMNLTVEPTDSSVSGNVVTETAEWRDDVSAAAGVSRYLTRTATTVQDGKVVQFDLTYDMDDAQTMTYLEYSAAQGAALPPGPVAFALSGSQPGSGSLTPIGDVTGIDFDIAAGPAGQLQPAALVQGGCPAGGAVQSPLASVLDGGSTTFVSHALSELQSGGFSVSVQASETSTSPAACGEVPPAAPLPAPSPAPAPTASPPPAGTTAPDTGTGNTGDGRAVQGVALLALLGAGLVAATTGAFIMRRRP